MRIIGQAVLWILGVIVAAVFVYIAFIYGNAAFDWGMSKLPEPVREHLALAALAVSSGSFFISAYTANKAEIAAKKKTFSGYISNFDGKQAKLFIANEKDELQLISVIRILGSKQELPLGIKYENPVLALAKQSYVELEIEPLSIHINEKDLISLQAKVELLNGKIETFKLIDKTNGRVGLTKSETIS